MDIPNLPTDNLYKFRALSGVAIMIVSVFIMGSLFNNLTEDRFKLELETKILAKEITNLVFDATQLNSKINILRAKTTKEMNEAGLYQNKAVAYQNKTSVSKIIPTNLYEAYKHSKNREEERKEIIFYVNYYDKLFPTTFDIIKELKQIEVLSATQIITTRQIEFKNITVTSKENILEYKKKNIKYLNFILSFLLVYGFILSFKGFKDWYTKVQKPMDEKLQAEIKKLNEEIE